MLLIRWVLRVLHRFLRRGTSSVWRGQILTLSRLHYNSGVGGCRGVSTEDTTRRRFDTSDAA